jgi:poly(A) polymerase
MKIKLRRKIFKIVAELAEKEDIETYVVGGYVRDVLLKRKSPDIDFVVVGNGIEFAKKLAKKINPRIKVNIFKNFGTAMFVYKDMQIEFVGARKESYNRYSRKPIVEDGSLEDDQKRRDFTINAMAISMNVDNLFELIDPFNGLEDLKNKIIRTPQNADITFSDDPLRMMRAIRFATQLDFTICSEAYEAIKKNKERIKIVSSERISDELNKIILSPKPSIGFKLLFDTGLLEIIFPEMSNLSGIEYVNGVGHKDIFQHTIKVLDNVAEKTDNLWIRWAAILHDIGKPKTKKFVNNNWTFHSHQFVGAKMIPDIFRRLRLPLNEKMKFVQKLVEMHHRPISLVNEPITDSAIRRLVYDAGDELEDLMTLVESDITTQYDEKKQKFLRNFQNLRRKIKEVAEKDFIRNWQPPIDGNEIMRILNLKPSKIVGELKLAIKDAILDGKIENSYQAAYNYLLYLAQKYNLVEKNNSNE